MSSYEAKSLTFMHMDTKNKKINKIFGDKFLQRRAKLRKGTLLYKSTSLKNDRSGLNLEP